MRDSQNQSISQRTEVLSDKLLLGRFTLAEIAKITGIPEQGLQNYLSVNSNLDYQQVPSSS